MEVTLLVLTVTINYRIILLIMLFITSSCKFLKIEPSRDICTYATWLSLLLPNKHPNKHIYLCATAQLENVQYYRVSLENKKDCFFKYFLATLALTLNDMLSKKNYVLKMMLLHPDLATNARVVFKLCLLLINTLTYHASKT